MVWFDENGGRREGAQTGPAPAPVPEPPPSPVAVPAPQPHQSMRQRRQCCTRTSATRRSGYSYATSSRCADTRHHAGLRRLLHPHRHSDPQSLPGQPPCGRHCHRSDRGRGVLPTAARAAAEARQLQPDQQMCWSSTGRPGCNPVQPGLGAALHRWPILLTLDICPTAPRDMGQ